MSGNKYLNLQSGIPTSTAASQTSAGAGDAGKIVALNSAGLIDTTMLPDSPDTTITASETIAAGGLVNIWNSSGVKVRNADNTSTSKQAHGFCVAGVTSGNPGTIHIGPGINTGVSGLTVGAEYYLDTVGAVTATAPTSGGTVVQSVGVAKSATELEVILGSIFVN